MKILKSLIALTILNLPSMVLADFGRDFFGHMGLRENQKLIIEISNVQMSSCHECQVQYDKYSYDVEVKDAYLKVKYEDTARGRIYSPYLESYKTKVEVRQNWDLPKDKLPPSAGLYVGTIWQVCAPGGIAANGDCMRWKVKYSLEGKVEKL